MEIAMDNKTKAKLSKKDVTSLKTSLYLFYIFALMASQILAMDIGIEVSENVRGYFQSVGYGVVLLFAIDKFMEHIISDNERVKKFEKKCMVTHENKT